MMMVIITTSDTLAVIKSVAVISTAKKEKLSQIVVVRSQVGSGMLLGVMLMLLLIMSPLTDGNVRSTT